jgi:hypothetical protein
MRRRKTGEEEFGGGGGGIWRETLHVFRKETNAYYSEGSQTVPSRPSGIGGWWQCRALGNGLLNYETWERRRKFVLNFERRLLYK